MQQILAFSSVYFISVTALDVITNVGAIDDLTSTARLVMLLPVAFLDAIFILWVFTALSATLRTLQFRNATVKLQLYRRFTNALAAWVWISAAWVAYEMYSKAGATVALLLLHRFTLLASLLHDCQQMALSLVCNCCLPAPPPFPPLPPFPPFLLSHTLSFTGEEVPHGKAALICLVWIGLHSSLC